MITGLCTLLNCQGTAAPPSSGTPLVVLSVQSGSRVLKSLILPFSFFSSLVVVLMEEPTPRASYPVIFEPHYPFPLKGVFPGPFWE